METHRQQLAQTVKGCREQLGDNLPDQIRQLQRELGDDIRASVVDVEINRKRSATDEGFAAYLKSSNERCQPITPT